MLSLESGSEIFQTDKCGDALILFLRADCYGTTRTLSASLVRNENNKIPELFHLTAEVIAESEAHCSIWSGYHTKTSPQKKDCP